MAKSQAGSSDRRWLRFGKPGIALLALVMAGLVAWHYWPQALNRPMDTAEPDSVASDISGESGPVPFPLPADDATADDLRRAARDMAEQLVASYPNDPASCFVMGKVEFQGGHSEKARQWWEKALEKEPRFLEIYSYLAADALRRGEDEQAVQWLAKGMQLAPRSPVIANRLANALMNLGKIDEARALLQDSVRQADSFAGNHYLLGQIALQKQEYDEAKRHFQRAIELHSDYSHAYYGLAMACAQLDQMEEAETYRERFRAIRQREAAEEMDELRRREDTAMFRRMLGETYRDVGRVHYQHGAFDLSERAWLAAAALDAKDTEARFALVQLCQRRGQAERAMEQLEQLRRLVPDEVQFHLEAGRLYGQVGQWEQAERAYRAACEKAPNQARCYAELAQFFLQSGREFDQALWAAEKAVRLQPTAGHWFLLGLARQAVGDTAGARDALDQAIDLEPENSLYRRARAGMGIVPPDVRERTAP